MTTQPTPELLAKQREEALAIWSSDDCLINDKCHPMTALIHGFLRAKQETYRELKRLREILEVVQNRFELTKSDRAFLISLKIAKE